MQLLLNGHCAQNNYLKGSCAWRCLFSMVSPARRGLSFLLLGPSHRRDLFVTPGSEVGEKN